MHPSQLRKLIKTKKKKKYKPSIKIQEGLKNWLKKTQERMADEKIELDLNYRKKLKENITKFMFKTKINCANIDKFLYFLDSKKLTKKGLKLLGCGSNGCALSGCIDFKCNSEIVVKLSIKTGEYPSDDHHPSIIEHKLYREMNTFLTENISPHYSFFYGILECDSRVLEIITDSKRKANMRHTSFESGSGKNVLVTIAEKANSDLLDYIKSKTLTIDVFKILMFQICFMLTTTQYYIPGFRHNDFKPDNILLNIYKPKNKYNEYIIFGKSFYIPDIGISVKMWDLDFSCADKFINSKVEESWSDRFGCNSEHNPIYDLHCFINYLYSYYYKYLDSEVKSFVNEFLKTTDKKIHKIGAYTMLGGEENKFTSYCRLTGYNIGVKNLIPEDMESPADMLYFEDDEDLTDLFSEFIIKPADTIGYTFNSKITISSHEIDTRKDMFNVYLD